MRSLLLPYATVVLRILQYVTKCGLIYKKSEGPFCNNDPKTINASRFNT